MLPDKSSLLRVALCYLTNALKRHCVMTHNLCVEAVCGAKHLLAASQIHFTECIVKRGQIPKNVSRKTEIPYYTGVNLHSGLQETTYQISKFTPALVFTDNQEMQFLTKEKILKFTEVA